MQKIVLPQHPMYKTVFAIINTVSGTYVCPGWHPVPPGTTREQIEFDMTSTPSVKEAVTEEPEMASSKSYEVVVSGSKPGREYVVKMERGRWSCTCPASTFRRGDCKHIKVEQKKVSNGK